MKLEYDLHAEETDVGSLKKKGEVENSCEWYTKSEGCNQYALTNE